jgi:hypothetical protein
VTPSHRPLATLGLLALACAIASPGITRADDADKSKPAAAAAANEAGWIQLFNGKDLDGWTPKIRGHALGEDPLNTFRVEDGLLKVSYDRYKNFDNQFGHLFHKTPHGKYRLRIEYRFVGEQCPGGAGWAFRNSGAMIHGQDPKTMRVDQDFPVSIEVQFLGGSATGERPTANLCTPGTNVVMDGKLLTRHCTNSTSKTIRGDAWVTVEVEAHGAGVITHKVNGETVITYEKPQFDPTDADAKKLIQGDDLLIPAGTISLQSESHPIEFRKVELLPLEE